MIRGVSQATQAPVSRPNRRRLAYLRVLMIRGVSQATHASLSRPNRRRLAYLRVLMIRGVSQATQAPVSRPNKEEQSRNIQYSEHLKIFFSFLFLRTV
jgi:hypothetical protein